MRRGAALAVALGLGFAGWLLWRPEPAPEVERTTLEEGLPRGAGRPGADEGARDSGFVGVVLARESVDVAAPVEGRLETLLVRLGDHVQRGATIATLEEAPFRRELAMAEAARRAAEAEESRSRTRLEEARERLERAVSLAGYLSEADRATAEVEEKLAASAREAAEAHLERERAQVEQLRGRLAETRIVAPFDGTIAARYQDPGVILRAAAPIVRIIRSGELWVRFAVPEEELAGLTVGRTVSVVVDSWRSQVPAVIEQIAPEVDPAAQLVVVEARLTVAPDPGQPIPSGLKCRVLPPGVSGGGPRGA